MTSPEIILSTKKRTRLVKNMAALSLEGEDFPFTNGAHVLPWDRFRRWIACFCVVTFDIEVGQAMEVSSLMKFLKIRVVWCWVPAAWSSRDPGIFTFF
jgi:hypothetical protein